MLAHTTVPEFLKSSGPHIRSRTRFVRRWEGIAVQKTRAHHVPPPTADGSRICYPKGKSNPCTKRPPSSFTNAWTNTQRIPRAVYPRVKAKSEEEEVSVAAQEDTGALLLRVLDSLSLEDRRSPGNEHDDDSQPQARIPKSYVPITPMPSIVVSKGPSSHHKAKNVKENDLDNRTNIRASSIPRPRAVLSSPDNDGMIGNRNKLLRERQSVLKTSNSGPGTVMQGKTILKKDGSTTTTRRMPKECDGKSQLNERLAKEPRVPQQKPVLRKGKPTTETKRTQAFHLDT